MLTKMPKVGDVLIAKKDIGKYLRDLTAEKEYVIKDVYDDGDAFFEGDDGANRYIDEDRFHLFTLKSEAHTAEYVGSIEEIELETTEVNTGDFHAKYHVISLTVDDAGLTSVRNLARQSGKESLRKHLQTKIDALQKELDAL